MRLGLAAIAATAILASGLSAEASTLPAASFEPGSTVGLGYTGLSYDMAGENAVLGATIGNTAFEPGPIKIGVRGVSRFFSAEGISAGVIAGLQYDPGTRGQRSYLVPDAGLAVAYRFPGGLTLMVNVTLTVNQYLYPDPINPQPPGSLLQRLVLGPNTTFGGMLPVSDHLRLTVGGGSLVGMQLSY